VSYVTRDILLERLTAQLRELPAEMVLGPVAAHIETTLSLERSQHQTRLVEAMNSDRYQTLMKMILLWQTRPPLTRGAGKPAADAQRHLRRAEKKVTKRLAAAGGDVEALHRARKAAKRYRYAAELSAQAGGRKASRIVNATTKLQTLLGEHQDSVVSAQFLRRLGAEAGAGGGQNGFTYGFLTAQEWQRAQQIRDQAARRWGNKSG
jgi:CHAD domain-containing protein